MWFAVALLFFCLLYGIVRTIESKAPPSETEGPLPAHRHIVALALLMGASTFLVRIVQPMGTNILNMQLCFFSQYVVLFIVGICAARRNWLLRIPYAFGMRWFAVTLSVGSMAWGLYLFALLKTHSEDKLGGGLTWQSAAMSFWESFFCLGICLGLIVLFREKFNRRGKLTQC
jgi:hypothetical protein